MAVLATLVRLRGRFEQRAARFRLAHREPDDGGHGGVDAGVGRPAAPELRRYRHDPWGTATGSRIMGRPSRGLAIGASW